MIITNQQFVKVLNIPFHITIDNGLSYHDEFLRRQALI